MGQMSGLPYDYGEEERPRQGHGRSVAAFVLGLLLGVPLGFWAGRGATFDVTDVAAAGPEWVLLALIPLGILVVVMMRLREQPARTSAPTAQRRGFVMVLVGLLLALGVAAALMWAMGR
ncbi:MAG TPA: hypothetical protein P5195_03605 [Anaerolineae bacterium]|nr:hypothetical protein [Anaerolineae bacterium]HRT31322.1 hypothetical protein [Anaerolineae bacterium]HRU94302.1 hypothetical protein [Anaerolineae bacterium]